MNFGKSRRNVDLSETGSRAVETLSELADQARSLAREVGQVASPALQHSAESLAHALERAADSTIAKAGEQQAAEVALAARERLADASEKLAEVIRPRPKKKQHHRIRNAAIALAVVGGIAGLVQSPLRAKLTERLFGPPPDDEPESITLPGPDISAPEDAAAPGRRSSTAREGNGVPSTTAGAIDSPSQG